MLATQNPVDFHGTYPLPEAQLDRFGVRVGLGYPAPTTSSRCSSTRRAPARAVEPVAEPSELLALQAEVRGSG